MIGVIIIGVGLGVALNQIRVLQKRLDDVETLLEQVVNYIYEEKEQ